MTFPRPAGRIEPSRGPTVQKPILEIIRGALRIRLVCVMIEPEITMAEAPDYLPDLPKPNFQCTLKASGFLVMNNIAALHGRGAFAGGRTRGRFLSGRRPIDPGLDPVHLI